MIILNSLTSRLSKHFSLHPARQKTLSSLIVGALSSGNVHHHSLARYVDSPNPEAAERRVERFFVKRAWIKRNMLKQSLNFWDLMVNLTSVLIGQTGNLERKTSIISS